MTGCELAALSCAASYAALCTGVVAWGTWFLFRFGADSRSKPPPQFEEYANGIIYPERDR